MAARTRMAAPSMRAVVRHGAITFFYGTDVRDLAAVILQVGDSLRALDLGGGSPLAVVEALETPSSLHLLPGVALKFSGGGGYDPAEGVQRSCAPDLPDPRWCRAQHRRPNGRALPRGPSLRGPVGRGQSGHPGSRPRSDRRRAIPELLLLRGAPPCRLWWGGPCGTRAVSACW